jgi:hypothetical protein
MTVNISSLAGAGAQLFDNNGVPLAGGLIYTYLAGTTTPATTYTSNTGLTAHPNPIVLDAAGRIATGEVWLTTGVDYKFLVKTSVGVQLGSYDNIPSINDFTAVNAAVYAAFANTTNVALGDALVGFKQSNSSGALTSAVGRTVHQKLQESVSVKDFGATGDGTTDDTGAIQAAITAVTASNGSVYVPTGTYNITSLTITSSITLYGDGVGSILRTTSATGDAIYIDGVGNDPGCVLEYLYINSTVTRTAGYMVNSHSSQGTKIRNCRIDNGYNGVGITGNVVQGVYIQNCVFYGISLAGSAIDVTAQVLTQGIVGSVFSDLWIAGTSSLVHTGNGINVACVGDLTINNVSTLYCDTGLNVQPATGATVQALFVSNCFFDSGDLQGLNFSPAGGSIQLVKCVNVWAATFGLNGALLSGTGNILETEFVNCTFAGNGNNGLFIASTIATNTSFIGGCLAQNVNAGFIAFANVNNFRIIGATIGATGQFTANNYGVEINPGTSDNYIISNNTFTTNTTANYVDGGTGNNKFTGGNTGGGGAVRVNVKPSVEWGVDYTPQAATTIVGSGGAINIPTGSGMVLVHNSTTKLMAIFLVFNQTVTKVSGDASIVAGAAGVSQIGLEWDATQYRVVNGYAASQSIYVGLIRTNTAN